MPLVNRIGGLKDTVIDFSLEGGFGITFDQVSVDAVNNAIKRGSHWYSQKEDYNKNTKYIMSIDHSWDKSAQEYIDVYNTLK